MLNKERISLDKIKPSTIIPTSINALKKQTMKIQSIKYGQQINLNIKMQQIQSIFKTQKKRNGKKMKFHQNFTDFQLYITKRDILRQRNQQIQKIRKLMKEEKIQKTKQKVINSEQQQQQVVNQFTISLQKQSDIKNEIKLQKQSLINDQVSNQYKSGLIQKQQVSIPSQNSLINKQKLTNKIKLKQFQIDDNYFQRRFQQKIMKFKFKQQTNLSIKNLIQPSSNRKTTVDDSQSIKKQLNIIEQVAQKTVANFKLKQKLDSDLYNLNNDQQNDLQSVIRTARNSPTDFSNFNTFKRDQKSINWIIDECDHARKKFKVRKSKSVKIIKNNN